MVARETEVGTSFSSPRTWEGIQNLVTESNLGGIIYHCYLTPFARSRVSLEILSEQVREAVADIPTEPIAGSVEQVPTDDPSPVPETRPSSPVRSPEISAPPVIKRRRRKRSSKLLPNDGGAGKE